MVANDFRQSESVVTCSQPEGFRKKKQLSFDETIKMMINIMHTQKLCGPHDDINESIEVQNNYGETHTPPRHRANPSPQQCFIQTPCRTA